MLGDQIGEDIGQVLGTRVLPAVNGAPDLETTFEATGVMAGVHCTDRGTFHAVAQPNGTFRGEGQGVLVSEDGSIATWEGNGLGRMTPTGGTTWRGSLYYRTQSEALSRLAEACCVYEFDIDETGKVEGKIWEWR